MDIVVHDSGASNGKSVKVASILELKSRPNDVHAVVLEIAAGSSLPVQPLTPRAEPIRAEQRVFLVGCRPGRPRCEQVVFQGKTGRGQSSKFGVIFATFEGTGIRLVDYIGAAVIDEQGQAVGVIADPRSKMGPISWTDQGFVEEIGLLLGLVQ